MGKNDNTGLLTHLIGGGNDDFCTLHFMRTALGGEREINSWRDTVRVAPQSRTLDAKVIGPVVKLSKKKPDPCSAQEEIDQILNRIRKESGDKGTYEHASDNDMIDGFISSIAKLGITLKELYDEYEVGNNENASNPIIILEWDHFDLMMKFKKEYGKKLFFPKGHKKIDVISDGSLLLIIGFKGQGFLVCSSYFLILLYHHHMQLFFNIGKSKQ